MYFDTNNLTRNHTKMNDKITCTITFQKSSAETTKSDLRPATIADVFEIVKQLLSEMDIYVLESDITNAQNSVKNTIKQTSF